MTADPTARFSLVGKSIVITGASGSMGREAALGLGAAGANITLAGGNQAALEELAARPELAGAAIAPFRPDTPEDAKAIVDAAMTAFGRLDGMLVASGMNKVALITDMDVADWESVMDANVRGSWLMAQAAGRVLIEQGEGGSLVLVSSTRGKLGHPAGYTAYCPSKAAVDLLGKTLAAEWGGAQIRVNVIAPTVFRSELTEWMYADDEKGRATREAMFARIPLKRFAEPEDFVGALVYLLSDASTFMTGQVLYLDGGYTAC
ncbi:MAG: SDR family oxidoreductase [Actinobacteria bacterium]|nr:SDR family oxidoreductase [Actinomycetota bacterium]